jgi:hypothetical protein
MYDELCLSALPALESDSLNHAADVAVPDFCPDAGEDAPVTTVLTDTSHLLVLPDRPVVAGYEILGELGRGGMGVVYLALQKATKRRVALKLMLHGRSASTQQRRRFEREIDLVSILRHPHIVTVFDSGVTVDGLPFYVMEHIQGVSLTNYLRTAHLTLGERLRLFIRICAAVSYAHQRGIIHRDLKPANIRIDTEGEPHILDFGLAKMLAAPGNSASRSLTDSGEFIGTLAYSAPEQATGDPGQADVRADVYALGVILYEMLTDQHPRPLGHGLSDFLKALTWEEPDPPSTRQTSVIIDESLDAITLKALARDRERRYQSAGALAEDVERYRAGEPIQARPPSLAFLLRQWLHHNARTATWTLLIGLVCGGLSAVAVGVSLLPLLQQCLATYELFPGLPRPWLAVDWTVSNDWRIALNFLGAIAFVGLGLFTGVLVRPRDRMADIFTGLATGLVGGVTAFAISGGWATVLAVTLDAHVHSDLVMLGESVGATPEHTDEMLERYPDLRAAPEPKRGRLLADKIASDLVAGTAVGMWLGLLFIVTAFGSLGVLGTVLTGELLRRPRSGGLVLTYLEATLPSAFLVLLLFFWLFFPSAVSRATGLAILLFVVLACLAVIATLHNWRWPIRGTAYTLGVIHMSLVTTGALTWPAFLALGLAGASLLGGAFHWRLSSRQTLNPGDD